MDSAQDLMGSIPADVILLVEVLIVCIITVFAPFSKVISIAQW